jgi:outer membrane lipoprotein SlyB
MRRIVLGITLTAALAVLAPAFASALQNPANPPGERIRGTVQSVNGTNAVMRADDGRTIRVDMSALPAKTATNVKPGDRVVVAGVVDSANRVKALSLRDDGPGPASADKGQWQRIHGQVQGVQGSTLKFRADDGRMLTVDMSAVGPEIQRALTQNERVTVIGFPGGGGPNQFRAEYIQQDSSDASRQPSASPKK